MTEKEAQELIDHMVMKFRMVKFARVTSYTGTVLPAPGMGYSGSWWYGTGWTFYGNKERLPFPAYSGKHGTVSGTEPDCSLFFQTAGIFQKITQQEFL